MLNGNSGMGQSAQNSITYDTAQPGEPQPWRPFQVIW